MVVLQRSYVAAYALVVQNVAVLVPDILDVACIQLCVSCLAGLLLVELANNALLCDEVLQTFACIVETRVLDEVNSVAGSCVLY